MLRLAAALAALLASGCGKRLSEAECTKLLDRYTELLVRSDREDTSEAELIRLKQAARERAHRDRAFQACPEQVSRGAFECAMAAENVDRLEQCML
jgi:hypothetical protein